MTARCPVFHWTTLFSLTGSLFLTISGSTILNMWYDRDIDSQMKRTSCRPLPSGIVQPREALGLGLLLAIIGVAWAVFLSPLYALIVAAGLFFDVIVYTVWLKRRTCWSILWGGISGGMPILAGRCLGAGQIDGIGLVLAAAVLFWIPTHILTFSIRNAEDYARARIPTVPSVFGFSAARLVITLSSLAASLAIGTAAIGIGMTWGYLRVLAVLSFGLFCLAFASLSRPNERLHFGLFKYASVYMLSAMLLFIANSIP
jgi:protoheme IX farnesyltransferase